MMDFQAAGHHFSQTQSGIRCVSMRSDFTTCDAAWSHIRTATEDDVGKRGFAHADLLTAHELAQIVTAREAQEKILWEAVIDAASAGSR